MAEHIRGYRHVKEHGHAYTATHLPGKKMFWVALLNGVITGVEIIGGILAGSLALLADAVHNLSDTLAIVMSYIANRIAQRSKDAKRTYGYQRAEILSALLNSMVLLAISIVLLFKAYKRLKSPESIDGALMIVVAFIGFCANIVSVYLLQRDSQANLNIKSSYLHLLSDTLSSVGVFAGGIAIRLWGVVWIDPLITVVISLYILKETGQIIKKTVGILMQSAAPLDYAAIKKDIEALARVRNIHHVHSWMIDEKTIYFEAHIDLDDMRLSEAEVVCGQIERLLKERYGIRHVTLQAEVDKCCDKNMFKT